MTEEELVATVISTIRRMTNEAELTDWLRSGTTKAPRTKLKPLGSELIRHLYEPVDPLTLVVRAHLYIEFFLDAIVTRKFKHATLLLKNRDFTFSMKLDTLRAANALDNETYEDIKLVNNLRNKFGHNLRFQIASFDASRFTYWQELQSVITKLASAEAKNLLGIYVFQYAVWHVLARMTKKHPYLAEIPGVSQHLTAHGRLWRGLGEIHKDAEQGIDAAVKSGALVLIEGRREAYWAVRMIPVECKYFSSSWNFFVEPVRRAKLSQSLDHTAFLTSNDVAVVSKLKSRQTSFKSRLTDEKYFPGDRARLIQSDGRFAQPLRLPPATIRIIDVVDVEIMKEFIPGRNPRLQIAGQGDVDF